MLIENNHVFASLTVYTTKLFCCEFFSLAHFSLSICLKYNGIYDNRVL